MTDSTKNQSSTNDSTEHRDEPAPGVAEQAASLIDDAPDVSQHAIDLYQEKENAAQEQKEDARAAAGDSVDKDGNAFDPEKHVTDENGKPVFNADGKTLKKRRGAKKGVKREKEALKVPGGESGKVTDRVHQQGNDEQARFTGIMMANTFLGAAQGVLGDEWAPRKSQLFDEQKHLEEVTIKWVQQTGYEMNPTTALMFAWSSYMLPRLSQPETKEKIKKAGGAARSLVSGKKGTEPAKQEKQEKE